MNKMYIIIKELLLTNGNYLNTNVYENNNKYDNKKFCNV